MTREQAIEVLINRYNSGVIRGRIDDEWRLATDTVIVALRGPQPDPITGLVPCGCGGKAGFHYSVMMRDNDCYVECGICGGHTKVVLSEDKARDAWNTAMGYNPHIQTAPKPTSDTQTDNHNRQGCRYCDWIDITRAHEDEDGPINYCRVCGRRLRKSE